MVAWPGVAAIGLALGSSDAVLDGFSLGEGEGTMLLWTEGLFEGLAESTTDGVEDGLLEVCFVGDALGGETVGVPVGAAVLAATFGADEVGN